jgi:L-fuconolactonase
MDRADWLAQVKEEILEPELPICDPHHHLWDHPGRRYLLDELLADTGSGHNVLATVSYVPRHGRPRLPAGGV